MNACIDTPQYLSHDLPISLVAKGFEVETLIREIGDHPDVWDRYTLRKEVYNGPHNQMSDIWVRYNSWDNYKGDPVAFNNEHISSWYPVVDDIPSVKKLVMDVYNYVGGVELGGVLITRIPPNGIIAPHVDKGWHARYYEKFAVQLCGNEDQSFNFVKAKLSAKPGDLYTFDNSQLHWVTNNSLTDRMTLIVCLRRYHGR